MRKLFLSVIGATALLASGAAAAGLITTGLVLSEPTQDLAVPTNSATFCTVACTGTITFDAPGPLDSTTNGVFNIIGLNIEITDGASEAATGFTFGNIVPIAVDPISGLPTTNYVTVVNGGFTDVYASLSTSFFGGSFGLLSISGNDWTVSGAGVAQGGSGTAIPEPSALALLGIGLLGFGAAARRKQNKTS